MGESFKAACALMLIVALFAAMLFWFIPEPDSTAWILRISATLLSLLLIAVLLKLHFRADLAPDYLHASRGRYFNCEGLCFSFGAELIDGVCVLETHFQNQRDKPCVARIALCRAREFWQTPAEIDTLGIEISCEAAAYGVARLPLPLPAELQGKKQSFEIAASVKYPNGKGRRLRFRDGLFLRANKQLETAFWAGMTVAAALGGVMVAFTPAKTTIELPSDAAVVIPKSWQPEVITRWKLGDPPLPAESAQKL